ncbi:ComEC/Rec2 family competence protein [Glycocaulis sp.]|uniref:ComEC/Rec2 family competence protein n=1 Tax=Glycocaulis sp. TaxID=1969725 RepID=UPI003D1A8FE2
MRRYIHAVRASIRRECSPASGGAAAALSRLLQPVLPSRAVRPADLILWVPLAAGLGAAVYLSVPAEPDAALIPVFWLSALICLAAGLLLTARPALLAAAVLSACALAGHAHVQGRTLSLAPPHIEISDRARTVTGWVERIERRGRSGRVLLRVDSLQRADTAPYRVRLRINTETLTPGDGIRVSAVLSPPRGPAAAGGYDGARAAWYQRVALSGFSISQPQTEDIAGNESQRAFLAWRWRLAQRISDAAGPNSGPVIAALLTGERSGVTEAHAEALRLSGLGHLLAISGMHMALLAGGIYFAVRWLIASIEPFARAHDPRKPAALIALLAALGYLLLSGGAISTQRAFVMAAVMFTAVLIGRRAVSFQSLALAALIIIAFNPESVIEPGFQMSFAATAALIAVYEAWQRWRITRDIADYGWFARVQAAFTGLAVTSLVAGSATGLFAAFHFQRMAAYGFGANLVAMPVFSFWVMPAGVVGLLLAPFGLEGLPLMVSAMGMDIVLAIATWTSSLPGAALPALAPGGIVLGLYATGFALATLGRGLVRVAGVPFAAGALSLWALQAPPDMMITSSGVLVSRSISSETGERLDWQVSDRRRGRFEAGVLLQRAGTGLSAAPRGDYACDPLGCLVITAEGLRVAVSEHPASLEEDCVRADLVVARGTVSAWQKRRCAVPVLDDAARAELGSAEFWVRDGRIIRLRGANDGSAARVWGRERES